MFQQIKTKPYLLITLFLCLFIKLSYAASDDHSVLVLNRTDCNCSLNGDSWVCQKESQGRNVYDLSGNAILPTATKQIALVHESDGYYLELTLDNASHKILAPPFGGPQTEQFVYMFHMPGYNNLEFTSIANLTDPSTCQIRKYFKN